MISSRDCASVVHVHIAAPVQRLCLCDQQPRPQPTSTASPKHHTTFRCWMLERHMVYPPPPITGCSRCDPPASLCVPTMLSTRAAR